MKHPPWWEDLVWASGFRLTWFWWIWHNEASERMAVSTKYQDLTGLSRISVSSSKGQTSSDIISIHWWLDRWQDSPTHTKCNSKRLQSILLLSGFSCWDSDCGLEHYYGISYDIYIYMIWYDMIWYDLVWYDMIWYGMIWYDMYTYIY